MVSTILGPNGAPYQNGYNGHRPRKELVAALTGVSSRRRKTTIDASYDAARDTTDFVNYWANADRLDADSANSKAVRSKLVSRSRYETANNGFVDGIHQTYATDVVGRGPSLRMQTESQEFNQVVEAAFGKWAKTIKLRRKLWCMCHAKTQDGEAFGVLRVNPNNSHKVKLDLSLIETEQCQTPMMSFNQENQIDGITFDEFGNEESFDILKHHPGGSFQGSFLSQPEKVPARYVLHWFLMRRPGQHRAVPEFRSTLNVGAGSRRHREATLAAAETAADIAAAITTDMPPNEEDAGVSPLSTVPFEKRMMVALPNKYSITQMKAEHPNATYAEFHRAQINEQARPKSMPINKAMCDSSQHNFASGRLDHITYFEMIDYVEREDCNDLVLDPLFAVWWRDAVLTYQWDADPDDVPDHTWNWPSHAVEDREAAAKADDVAIKNGSLSPEQQSIQNGEDHEEKLASLARSYGVSVEEIKRLQLMNNFYMAFQAQVGMSAAKTNTQAAGVA